MKRKDGTADGVEQRGTETASGRELKLEGRFHQVKRRDRARSPGVDSTEQRRRHGGARFAREVRYVEEGRRRRGRAEHPRCVQAVRGRLVVIARVGRRPGPDELGAWR
jgi:hypothetical protein